MELFYAVSFLNNNQKTTVIDIINEKLVSPTKEDGEIINKENGQENASLPLEENSEEVETEGETEGSECQAGQVVDCQITYELASGTLFCVKGIQFCNDGYWSECHGG